MDLIGFDIGFSKTRHTSAVARFGENVLLCERATSEWSNRARILGSRVADVIAVDGPILKDIKYSQRLCETVFARGSFGRRCKPAFSHVPGTGRMFRTATKETAGRLASLTHGQNMDCAFPRVIEEKNIVEAFPNAFLGVLLPDSFFQVMPKLKRGKKFDWLYDQCQKAEVFRSVLDLVGEGSLPIAKIEENRDHEERAALICLLTAAGVAVGRYTAIGENGGGYFFLPPFTLWAVWARHELQVQREREPLVKVWLNGKCYGPQQSLP